MKCPNCNADNEDQNKFCIYCGSPLNAENVEHETEVVREEDVVENIQNDETKQENVINENVVQNSINETEVKKEEKKRHSIITVFMIILVITLILTGICVSVMFMSSSPEKLYKTGVEKTINSIMANDYVEQKVGNADIKLSLESDDSEYESLNGANINLGVKYDLLNEKMSLEAKADTPDASYLNLLAFVDMNKNKVYLKEDNIYDKAVEVDIDSSDIADIKESMGLDNIKEQNTMQERKALAKTAIKGINDNLDKGQIIRKKTTIPFGDGEKNVKDNVLVFNSDELVDFMDGFLDTIGDDPNFLDNVAKVNGTSYDNLTHEDIKEQIEEEKENMEYMRDYDANIEVHYYTYGLTNKFAGIALIATEDKEQVLGLEYILVDNNKYRFTIEQDGEELQLEIEISKFGKGQIAGAIDFAQFDLPVKANFDASITSANEVADFSEETVKLEDLDEDEIEKITENLEKTPLYSLLESLTSELDSSLSLDSTLDFGLDSENDSDSYNNNSSTDKKPSTSSTQNYVMSLDEKSTLTFGVPAGYIESDYSDESSRHYEKEGKLNTAYVTIYLSYGDAKEEIDESKDISRLERDDFYSNIKVQDNELEINGKKFNALTVEYDYGTNHDLHSISKIYTLQVDQNNYLYIEIEDDDNIVTDEEIEEFLTVSYK